MVDLSIAMLVHQRVKPLKLNSSLFQWIGLPSNIGLSCKFSHNPILWLNDLLKSLPSSMCHMTSLPHPKFPFQATLDGAEVPRGAEAQRQPDVLVGLLGGREQDARVLGQAADVEVGQLVGRHHLLVEFPILGRYYFVTIHLLGQLVTIHLLFFIFPYTGNRWIVIPYTGNTETGNSIFHILGIPIFFIFFHMGLSENVGYIPNEIAI